MDPRIWGPHTWFFLHSLTFSYPDNPTIKDKNDFEHFFYSLSNVLPCIICKNHFKEHLSKYPIENYLNNRNQLVNWMIDIHNIVNKQLNKPIVDNKIIIQKYNDLYTKKYQCPINQNYYDKCKNIILSILLIINIIIIIYFCFRKKINFNINILKRYGYRYFLK